MCPLGLTLLILSLAVWLFIALCAHAGRRANQIDALGDAVWGFNLLYTRLVHRLRVEGLELVPRPNSRGNVGPLVIVSNHTSGIDAMLLGAALPFQVRWMMLREMMPPALDPFWEWMGIIPIGPTGQDAQAARIAIRFLKEGGVVGLFPEGGLERPPRHVLPFEPGAGLLVSRSGARVLLAVIEGAPDDVPAYVSLFRFSRARVRFVSLLDYTQTKSGAAEIAKDLQSRVQAALGWPPAPTPVGGSSSHR